MHLPEVIHGGTGFQSSTGCPAISKDGTEVLLGEDCEAARLWQISVPPSGAPAWFPEFLEAVAGQRYLDPGDRSEVVAPESVLAFKQRLSAARETDFYTRWARRWLGFEGDASTPYTP